MKRFLAVVLIIATVIFAGCGNEKSENQVTPAEPPIPKITREEAQLKLAELSTGLNVRVDDMKEVTFCHCPINHDIHPQIHIIPFVVVDKDYNVSLRQDILYVGRVALYFDKLYIKTLDGVQTFRYEKTVKSFDGGYVGEEYAGLMTGELYQKLQAAINEGGAKFRIEGREFAERELTQKELSDMAKIFSIYEYFNNVKVE